MANNGNGKLFSSCVTSGRSRAVTVLYRTTSLVLHRKVMSLSSYNILVVQTSDDLLGNKALNLTEKHVFTVSHRRFSSSPYHVLIPIHRSLAGKILRHC